MTNPLRLVLGLALLVSSLAAVAAANDTPIRVDRIKYADLGKLVRSHKGKVVVVDFWADFCIPCKREFPHLVEMYNKYKNDGLVAVTVSLDNPTDTRAAASALQFLEKQQAGGLTNLVLDETPEMWARNLGINGPPCVFVFNREGRIAGRWDDKVDYAVVEKTVAELLKK